jgi:hypothetical protein
MTDDLQQLTDLVARRRLTLPLQLFLAGHRPLAFFVGQLLYLTAPLALLAGWDGVNRWAAWLSAPDLTTLPADKQD